MISLRKEANVVFNFKFISVLITIKLNLQMNYIKLTNNPIVNLSKQIKVTEKGGGAVIHSKTLHCKRGKRP